MHLPLTLGLLLISWAPAEDALQRPVYDAGRYSDPTAKPSSHSFRTLWRHVRGLDRGPWPMRIPSTPGTKPPARVAQGVLRITWINQATTLIQYDGINILTDPIWSERAGVWGFGPIRVCEPGLRFEDLPPLDAVLVSHNHYDHLDLPTLRRLAKNHSCPIFAPRGNGQLLARSGWKNAQEMNWWEATMLAPGVQLRMVPARHGSRRGLWDENKTLWGGFVITGSRGGVYFAGDTAWGSHFAQIRDACGPIRAALLPIGSYLPRSFMATQHESPSEALEAAMALDAATFIPIHYATFPDGDDGYDEPLRDLESAIRTHPRSRERVRVLSMGQGLDLS